MTSTIPSSAGDTEPGLDLSIPVTELGEHEQMVMDLLLSKPWHVQQIVRDAAPVQEIQSFDGGTAIFPTGPGSVTVTITVHV